MQYYQENTVLGSIVQLSLVFNKPAPQAQELMNRLWRMTFAFERRFSRFLPESELSIFNRNAGNKQPLSDEFRDILLKAKNIGLKTGGLYNPFILPALQAAGYKNSLVKGYEKDVSDDHSHKSVADVSRLEIGDDWASIPYDSALDLGGCGKGYLADKLADETDKMADGYWFSLGGDIVSGGVDDNGNPWVIEVQAASKHDLAAGYIHTKGDRCAAATSGTVARTGKQQGKPWHHLIDPRSLKPADTDIVLATLNGRSAFDADVLASCAVILGSKRAASFLSEQGVTDWLIQYRDKAGNIRTKKQGSKIRLK